MELERGLGQGKKRPQRKVWNTMHVTRIHKRANGKEDLDKDSDGGKEVGPMWAKYA